MGNYAEVWIGSFYLGRTKVRPILSSGIRKILSAIFVAFHEFDGRRMISTLNEHYNS